jgi:hypothetical protein
VEAKRPSAVKTTCALVLFLIAAAAVLRSATSIVAMAPEHNRLTM